MIRRVRDILDRLGGRVGVVLAVAVCVIAGIWVFVEILDEVQEGDTQRFDEWALVQLRQRDDPAQPIGPRWLHEVGRDITGLGGVAVLSLVTFAVAGYLHLRKKRAAMLLVLVATLGGLLLSTGLKRVIHRDRPDIVPHLSMVYTSSFPSGHSMLSASVYLTLGALLARLEQGRVIKIYVLGVAMILTLLVGVSRVYMGVHYPTDVLAGWTAGLVWALICWFVARQLQHRGAVETDDE